MSGCWDFDSSADRRCRSCRRELLAAEGSATPTGDDAREGHGCTWTRPPPRELSPPRELPQRGPTRPAAITHAPLQGAQTVMQSNLAKGTFRVGRRLERRRMISGEATAGNREGQKVFGIDGTRHLERRFSRPIELRWAQPVVSVLNVLGFFTVLRLKVEALNCMTTGLNRSALTWFLMNHGSDTLYLPSEARDTRRR